MGIKKFARSTGVSTTEAKEFLIKYKERYAKIFKFLELQERLALSKGYVETIFGRKREFKFDKQISLEIINDGGWHFTRLQTAEEIHSKELDAEHHDEYRISGKNVEKIKQLIKNKKIDHDHLADTKDFKYGNEFNLDTLPLEKLPKYIQENKEKYNEWFDYS